MFDDKRGWITVYYIRQKLDTMEKFPCMLYDVHELTFLRDMAKKWNRSENWRYYTVTKEEYQEELKKYHDRSKLT